MHSATPDVQVKLGPVIGMVTYNSARVLVEFDKEEDVWCSLQSEIGETTVCKQRSKANIPIVFNFKDLKPKTRYQVTLSCSMPLMSSFWTLRENTDNPGDFNVAIVSCNEISQQDHKPQEQDLWIDLEKRVADHELDYIFHIGDQIYMDMGENGTTMQDPYQICMTVLKVMPKDQWETIRPALLEVLRQEYRKTWTYPSVRNVLANIPNLTICDDHEFRDDWGYRPEDYTPGTADHFYGLMARQAYYEYQRQLREDIDWDKLESLKCEYYDHIFHGVGISFMEYRGCRTWFREQDVDVTHLGKQQAEWLDSLYKEHGKFENVSSALFITPQPLFFLSHFNIHLYYLTEDDFQEHWSYSSIPYLVKLLDLLREWKERRNGRELTIVGGDVHLGGMTDVFYKKKPIFQQFVSSAINGKAKSKIGQAILSLAQKMGKITDDYTVIHHSWIRQNNYGILNMSKKNGISTVKSVLKHL